MPMVAININLFAHILLDSESSGRYGVQGNTFHNTLGYLTQYINARFSASDHPLDKNMEKINHFMTLMDDLVLKEKIYAEISLRPEAFESHASKIKEDILALKPGQKVFLPGGWVGYGTESFGHAMIYQFEKNENNDIVFSVINAGAGVQFHEKTSSKEKELFSPKKTWRFKPLNTIDEDEFLILIKKLMAELILGHPQQTARMNETKLYRDIEKSCHFLNATALKSLPFEHVEQATTGSQLAGTCSQRSIHQMLKMNFDTLDNYQKFIFEFQKFALHDYLMTHPAPRAPAIINFVSKGIENMLKILDEIKQLSPEEKLSHANDLKNIFDEIHKNVQVLTISKPITIESKPYTINEARPTIKYKKEKPVIGARIPSFEPFIFEEAAQFSPQKFTNYYHLCLENQSENPIWVIESIQDIMSRLPLPKKIPDPTFQYYAHLSAEEVEQVLKQLQALRTIYISCRDKVSGKTIHARDFSTLLSMYAYYDFLSYDEKKSCIHQHRAYFYIKEGYLDRLKQSPLIANQRPQLDARVSEIFAIYQDVSKPTTSLKQAVISLLRSVFTDNPNISQELQQLSEKYIQSYRLSPENITEFAKEQIKEIFFLLGQYNDIYYQSIRTNSQLQDPKFSSVRLKLQNHLDYLQFLGVGLEQHTHKGLHFFIESPGRDKCKRFSSDIFVPGIWGSLMPTYTTIKAIIPCPSFYSLGISPAQEALLLNHFNGYKRTSNDLQLRKFTLGQELKPFQLKKQNVNAISKADYEENGLLHKRTAPQHQIIITLNDFTLNMERISDKNLKVYVENNLFQGTLLLQALERDSQLEKMGEVSSSFKSKFNLFIHQGLQHFQTQDGYLNENCLFFIMLKMKVLLYQTLIPDSPEMLKINHFAELLLMFNTHLNIEKDPRTLSVLHQFRFLTLQTKLSNQQWLSDEELDQLYASYVYYQSKGGLHSVISETFKYEVASQETRFRSYLQGAHFDFNRIYPYLQSFGFDIARDTFRTEYPLIYILKNKHIEYVFHFEEGRLYKDGQTFSPIPLALSTHPLLKFFNLDDSTSCLISQDGKTFTFFEPHTVRFFLQDNGNIIAHQCWTIDGTDRWYELRLMTPEHAKELKTIACSSSATHVPLVLSDHHFQAWICLDKNGDDFIAKDHQPLYGIDKYHGLYDLNQPKLKLTKPLLPGSFNQFEDGRFILWNLDKHQNGTVHLPRYGLDFNVSTNPRSYFSLIFSSLQEPVSIELKGTHFQLKDKVDILPEGTAALFFEDSLTTQQQCIVAVQPYYLDPKRPQLKGAYYHFTHDHHHVVQSLILNELFKESDKSTPAWDYQHAEKTIVYPVKNGVLIPQDAAASLYLCYIYMANHEYEKAWALLNQMSTQNLTGSYEEFSYLHMILKWLPFVNEGDEKAQEAIDESAECVSCQLKALAWYTDFLARGYQPEFPSYDDKTSANSHVCASLCQTRETFYNNLPSFIETQYKRLQRLKRHLPAKYQLSDEEARTLLNYYISHSNSDVHGALGYEIMQLRLKSLIKTFQILKNLQATSGDLPSALTQELQQIEQFIQSEQKILKSSTKLISKTLDLSCPLTSCDLTLLNEREEQIVKTFDYLLASNSLNETVITQAITKLRSSVTQETFLENFISYYQIASNKNHIHHQQVKNFCIKYLLSHRHQKWDDESNNIRFLCNILYRVTEVDEEISCSGIKELVSKLQTFSPAPIQVLEAYDVFEEPLISIKEMSQALLNLAPPIEPLAVEHYISPLTMDKTLQATLNSLNKDDFMIFEQFLSDYRRAESDYQNAIRSMTDSDKELAAGQAKYDCIHQQEALANHTLAQKNIITQLKHHVLETQQKLKIMLAEWDVLLNQVNTELQKHESIKLYSGQKEYVTKEKLLQCYFNCDLASYFATLPYASHDKNRIIEFNQRIHALVHTELEYQHHTRLINALTQNAELANVARIMMSENHVGDDPVLMFFQIKENILLHQGQMKALEKLIKSPSPLRYEECVEKVIMGGGKSKVVLPCMAQKKANGLNLVIVEVPKALLATNQTDLNQTSQQLFNQKAILFEFNRDSNDTPQRLEEIYNQFKDIIVNKNYLVTTGESIQSLQLKYIERLLEKPSGNLKDVPKQIQLFEDILSLLKNQGDAVIDEVHQGLLLKKKLNYTMGESKPLPEKIIQDTIALYQFINQLSTEQDLYLSIEKRLEQWPDLLPNFSNELINHPQSPLHHIIDEWCKSHPKKWVIDALVNYFENREITPLITEADQATRETLALYKEQIRLLQQTLNRHHREHYGPSKNTLKHPLEKRLAIPYTANEKPNERSQFGNVLETLNYTIQSLLADGIDDELLSSLFQEFQTNARIDFHQSNESLRTLDETQTGIKLNNFLQGTGLRLANIDLNNPEHIDILIKNLSHNTRFLLYILEQKILPQIHVEPLILHADAYQHVDIYHTVQGLSGTPWNHSTYHHRIAFNTHTSIGTDGYIQTLLKAKDTQIRTHDFTDTNTFMNQYLTPNLRAIIDISATLSGDNLKVAQEIARNLRGNQSAIKYVLYFNEDDILCAVSLKNPNKIIVIGTSSPQEIEQKLNCTPQERFTYYDQAHTVGADILQAPDAHALCLVNQKTHLQSFLQGVMRMRQIAGQQTIDIVVPSDISTDEPETLFNFMNEREKEQIKHDNFTACMAQMDNLIRQELLQRIYDIPKGNLEKKQELAQRFQDHFIKQTALDILKRYEKMTCLTDTKVLLEKHRDYLLENWKKCVGDTKIPEVLSQKMNALIHLLHPQCHEKSMIRFQNEGDEVEMETQKEVEVAVELELLTDTSLPNTPLKPEEYIPWTQNDLQKWFLQSDNPQQARIPLNQLFSSSEYFSTKFFCTHNYAYTYKDQVKPVCKLIKPVDFVLWGFSDEGLVAHIINAQEANEITHLLKTTDTLPHVWISDTNGSLLAGTRPLEITTSTEHQRLLEQINFFGGKLNWFLEQTATHGWLQENTAEKLTFFKQELYPYRETSQNDIVNITHMLKQKASSLKSDTSKHSPAHKTQACKLLNKFKSGQKSLSQQVTRLDDISYQECCTLFKNAFDNNDPGIKKIIQFMEEQYHNSLSEHEKFTNTITKMREVAQSELSNKRPIMSFFGYKRPNNIQKMYEAMCHQHVDRSTIIDLFNISLGQKPK